MANHKIRKKSSMRVCDLCEGKFDLDRTQCPHCGHWNVDKPHDTSTDKTVLLSEVEDEGEVRVIETGPWDKAFCLKKPGIPIASVTLLGGAPGAGKSTLSMQLCDAIATSVGKEVFYIGAEEGKKEYAGRARRLGVKSMHLIRLYPMDADGDLGAIMMARKPCAVVIDSLPGITDDPAEAAKICKTFKEYAVALDAPVIIIDHITKDGDLAGFMALQHDVDIVMLLFPNEGTEVRTLTVKKNRYAPANFDMHLNMTELGLVAWEEPLEDEADE